MRLFECMTPMGGRALCCSSIFLFNVFLKQEFQTIYNATTKRKITYTTVTEGKIRSGNEKQEG